MPTKMIQTAYGVDTDTLLDIARQLKNNECHINSLYGVHLRGGKVRGILAYDMQFAIGVLVEEGLRSLESQDIKFREELNKL